MSGRYELIGYKLAKLLMLSICTMLYSIAGVFGAYGEAHVATDSRIKTFIYSQNEVFPIVLHYGYQTSIEFGNEEVIERYSLGNSYAWQISAVENNMFMKPLEENIATNMTVMTNKRKYYFELISKSVVGAIDEEQAYVIRFFYPDETSRKVRDGRPVAKVSEDVIVPYNFGYKTTGANSLTPDLVFNDGKRTYFDYRKPFPEKMPLIKCKKGNGVAGSLLRTKRLGDSIVVDSMCDEFVMMRSKLKVEVRKVQ